jgi:glycosyltransferase involved in cell wall biosynthesis
MDKKIKFAFAHPMREQLARLFTSLNSLELVEAKSCNIRQNKKQFNESFKDNFEDYINKKQQLSFIQKIQKHFWLVNFRKYYTNWVDLLVASNWFLFTNKPYILYLEKATAIFWYNADHYYKSWCKLFLKNRLKDKNLKLIIFRTKTALEWFLNTYKGKDDEIYNLIKEKSVYAYPPNPYKPNDKILKRFKNPKTINIFFSSSSFILKWWYQLVRAFDSLFKKYNNLKLFLLTKKNTIDKESLGIIQKNKNIELYEPNFSQEELYNKFYLKSHIFVYPTFCTDSFAMVINEA